MENEYFAHEILILIPCVRAGTKEALFTYHERL